MVRRLLIGLCLLTAAGVSAQNTLIPSVSNYHLTWTAINPAYSGFRDALSFSSLYRSSLYGEVGPQDMQVNVHTPVNSKVALGAVVAYNSSEPGQGLYALMTTYAYRIDLGTGRLAFGLSAGIYGVNSNITNWQLWEPGDPSFPEEQYSRWFPNFGTGILYSTDLLDVGLSVPELLAIPGPEQSLHADPSEYRVIMTGSYLFDISTAFRLKPSVIIDYSQMSTTFKASVNAGLMDSRVFVGAAYDYPNYAIVLLNIQVNHQWLVGYAYTIGTSALRSALGGSHEVVLRWEFRQIVKTIPDDPFYF